MSRRETLKDKKKRKKIDWDVVIVLGVLGSVIVIAFSMALLQSGNNANDVTGNLGGGKQKEQPDNTAKVILTCAFFTVFVVVLAILKKINDKKKKKLQEERERFEKQQKLEEARERVKRAKMEEFLRSGSEELERRKREEELLRRTARKTEYRSGMTSQREYHRRDLNQFRDEDPELYFEEDDRNWFQRLIDKIKNLFGNEDE